MDIDYAKFTNAIMDYSLKGVMHMFSKKEFFLGVAVSLIAGWCMGYSKAREKFAAGLVIALGEKESEEKEEQEPD